MNTRAIFQADTKTIGGPALTNLYMIFVLNELIMSFHVTVANPGPWDDEADVLPLCCCCWPLIKMYKV